MKRHWIDYENIQPNSPMTFWVHRAVGDFRYWMDATEFDPPRQPVVAGKGYPVFMVELDGFTFEFVSLAELSECIRVFETKLLPRTINLSEQRGTSLGPNRHWLSRLPAKVNSWKYRQTAAQYLRKALTDFEETLAS